MSENFNNIKKAALEKFFERMNDMQKKAVFRIKGPLLILAGAGSGKTTVLINRIANMIFFGDAYNTIQDESCLTAEKIQFVKSYAEGTQTDAQRLSDISSYGRINPWNILASTFTNKAANELKQRLAEMLGEAGNGVTAATFHSACSRILRRECEHIGFHSNFTIYDTDDSLRTIKAILREDNISEKMFSPRMILSEISRQKDTMTSPDEYISSACGDFRAITIGKIYKKYQIRLKESNAMDFDDIICHTVELFENNPDVLDHYQNLYKYIMVDEYQDTNKAQFRLISLLAGKFNNLCAVGDDDQSIYKFRGATIENILHFEENFGCNGTQVIKLEQNYRSTQNILTCANILIENNTGRKGKNLWTAEGDGEKVKVCKCSDEREEAKFIADTIEEAVSQGSEYGDHAILYRVNAQSNALEQALIQRAIPYKIFGGLKFYDRKEIRDILAYLQVINNHADMLRLRRIINEPKRGIGEATVTIIEQISSDLGENPVDIMRNARIYAPLSRKAAVLEETAAMFDKLTEFSEENQLTDLLDYLLEITGYARSLKMQGDEGSARLENINELKSTMANYEDEAEEPSLSGFLEEISLYTDIDSLDDNADFVKLMTMHAAKGLEFPVVFVPGMEENIFPSSRSLDSDEDIEEERRLAYVAVTRAKKQLYLSYSGQRMLYGRTQFNPLSRFIKELPEENIEKISATKSSGILPVKHSSYENSMKNEMRLRKQSELTAENPETFHPGDRVKHRVFGEGTVLSVTPAANDAMVEIAFDTKGTKKIMANFSRIKKV